MKHTVLAVLMMLGSLPLWAQSNAAVGNADFEAERSRLAAERAAIEVRFERERAVCYQKFAVEDCLRDSRKRRRTETDHIKRQESAINDIERQRRGAAELQKLDEKAATRRPEDTPEKQEAARQSQQDREQRAADHAASRAATAAEAGERRRELEAKQRAQAEERAKAERERAAAPAAVERFESKQRRAAEHRADRERQNAERTKPRGAPLPPGPAASSPAR
jgi:hypothetical protein